MSLDRIFQKLKTYIKERHRSVIKRQLFIAFCCLSIIPSLIVGGVVYYWSWNNIIKNAEVYADDILNQVNSNIEQVIDSVENMALSIAINRELIYNLSYKDITIDLKTRNLVIEEIENVLFSNSNLTQMIYIETPASVVYSKTASIYVPTQLLRIYGSPYEDDVMKQKGSCFWLGRKSLKLSAEESSDGDNRFVRCASMLPNTEKTDYCGILSIFLRVRSLKAAITGTYKSIKGSSVLLVDQNGEVIVSSNDLYKDFSDRSPIRLEGASGNQSIKIDDKNVLLFYVKNYSTNWYIVSLITQNSLIESLQRGLLLVGCGIILIVLLCLFLSYFVTSKIIRMLDPLLSAMKSVKQGDLSARVPDGPANELTIVGQVFNETLDHYEELLKENYQKENMLAIARLNVLQGQLSPHFLSNTMDSINWTLVERQQYDISDVLVKLAHLLRYSISGSNDMVPLSVELNAVAWYLDICKLRFEDKLQYKIDIDQSLYPMMIPRFLIQPLVENSIVHGIERRIDGGQVLIRGRTENMKAIIEIIDNGPGFPADIKKLLLQNGKQENFDRAHVGLSNVIERTRLIYGKEGKFEILDNKPQGTCIRIVLPLL